MALARIYPCSPVPGAQVHGSAGGVVRRRWNWGGGFLCSLFRRFNESSITEYFRTYVRSTEASHYYRQTSLRFDFFFFPLLRGDSCRPHAATRGAGTFRLPLSQRPSSCCSVCSFQLVENYFCSVVSSPHISVTLLKMWAA